MISQQDIAGKLGVSRELVSKVLSGRMGTTRVHPDLRKKIIRKANELGYVPNRNALGLYSGKRGSIAVFVSPWGCDGAEFTYRALKGISDGLRPTMYQMWLCIFDTVAQFKHQADPRELRNRVDGVVVGGLTRRPLFPLLRKIEKSGTPVVTFFGDSEIKGRIPNLCGDKQEQGRLATEHLIARGCRRIATISSHKSRFHGYKQALKEAGLPFDPRLVIAFDWGIEDGRRAVRELLDRKIPFDGISAQSDYQAYGALQELLLHGIRVPEDVRLIGIDDAPLCLAGPISLSTVTSDCYAMGKGAIDMISRKIAGETITSHNLPPSVIPRGSS